VLFVPREQYDDGREGAARRRLLDVCRPHRVDYLHEPHRTLPAGIEAERFEVVVNLIDHATRERIRLRVQVPADDPACPRCSTWPGHRGHGARGVRHVRHPFTEATPTSPAS
jgi:NADH:ubiquinone oxidoreductase subunit C